MVHFVRRPHTQSERRLSVSCCDADDVTAHMLAHLVRGKRKLLPTSWDDKPVSLWKQAQFTNKWNANRQKYRPSHFDYLDK